MTEYENPEAKNRLIEIVQSRSFQIGPEMTLASGRKSTVYFNMKPTMLHPEGARLIGALICARLKNVDVDLVGGLEMGAVPLACAVAAVSIQEGKALPAFFVRKQSKSHGTQDLIEGLAPGEHMQGKRVVVLEDVTTTGGSALKAVEVLRDAGADVALVLTVVDREEGAADTFRKAKLRFDALLAKSDFLNG